MAKMTYREKVEAYKLYKLGEPLSDDQLKVLLRDTEDAINILDYRPDCQIVTTALIPMRETLIGYARARGLRYKPRQVK